MDSRAYRGEKQEHFDLKIKTAELLSEREDIEKIEFEKLMKYGSRNLRVDVLGYKTDGSYVFGEVKSVGSLQEALCQLFNHEKFTKTNKNNEYLAIVKPFTNITLKNIWKGLVYSDKDSGYNKKIASLLSSNTTVWTYDSDKEIKSHRIDITKESIIVDGEDVLKSKKICIG